MIKKFNEGLISNFAETWGTKNIFNPYFYIVFNFVYPIKCETFNSLGLFPTTHYTTTLSSLFLCHFFRYQPLRTTKVYCIPIALWFSPCTLPTVILQCSLIFALLSRIIHHFHLFKRYRLFSFLFVRHKFCSPFSLFTVDLFFIPSKLFYCFEFFLVILYFRKLYLIIHHNECNFSLYIYIIYIFMFYLCKFKIIN